jgi:hypothetical protein
MPPASSPTTSGRLRRYGGQRHGTAADRQREGERDQTGQQIERDGGSRVEPNPVHQHRKPEFAAAKAD